MAVHGKIDAATFGNNVAVTQNDATVTKNAADTVVVGDLLDLGGVNYLVREVTSTGFQVSVQHPDGVSRGGAVVSAVKLEV